MKYTKKLTAYLCSALLIFGVSFSAFASVTPHIGDEPTQNSTQDSDSNYEEDESSESEYDEEESTSDESNSEDTLEEDSLYEAANTDTQESDDENLTDEAPADYEDEIVSSNEIVETVAATNETSGVNSTIGIFGYACIAAGTIGILSVIIWCVTGRKKSRSPEDVAYEEVSRAEARNRAEISKNYNDNYNYNPKSAPKKTQEDFPAQPVQRQTSRPQQARPQQSRPQQARPQQPRPQQPRPQQPRPQQPRPQQPRPQAQKPRSSKYDTDEILREVLRDKMK